MYANYSPEISKLIKEVKSASYIDTIKLFDVGEKAISIIRTSDYKSAEAEVYIYYANYFYYARELDRVKKYLKLSESIANKHKDEQLSLFAKARLLFIGFEEGNKNDKQKLISVYEYCKDKGFHRTQVEILNLLGNIYEESNQSDKAAKSYIEGIAISEKYGFEEYPAKFKNNLGLLKLYTGSLDDALNDFESGLESAEKVGEQRLKDHIRINIAITYFEKKEIDKAVTLYEEVISDLRKNDIPRELASTFINLASSLFSLNKTDLGKAYIDSAIQVLEFHNLEIELTSAYIVKADYLLSIKNTSELLNVFSKIKTLTDKTGRLSDLSSYYLLLYRYELSQNNSKKALENYELHVKMRDSLDGIRNAKLIKELQLKYNVQEKEIELGKEKSKSLELEKQNQEERFIRWFLISFSVVIIVLVIVFFAFRYSNKLREKQEQFSRQLIDNIEEERKRIAQDLHDDIGQSLSIVKSRITKMKGHCEMDDTGIENEVGRVIEQTRQISHSLYPSYLEKIGLVRSVARLMEKIQDATTIQCSFEISENVDELSLQIKTHLYRIIQECVNNTVKHSGATALKVSIEQKNKGFQLVYQDNGKGLSKENKEGLGILSITERAKIINADIEIPDKTSKGFKLIVTF
jgi:signal transduction histidine kinase